MKINYKIILYSILILIVSTTVITYWYISGHLEYNALDYKFYKVSDIQIQSLIDIIIQIGIVGGIIPAPARIPSPPAPARIPSPRSRANPFAWFYNLKY